MPMFFGTEVNMPALRTNLVKIGNSHGIRIPKAVLQQIHLVDEVEIEVKKDCLIIKPAVGPRTGWSEAFKNSKNETIDPEFLAWERLQNESDDNDWTWK